VFSARRSCCWLRALKTRNSSSRLHNTFKGDITANFEIAYLFIPVSIIVAILYLLVDKQPRTRHRVIGVFLLSFLVISVGIASLIGFVGHVFLLIESLRNSDGRQGARSSKKSPLLTWPSGFWASPAFGSGATTAAHYDRPVGCLCANSEES
jgi:hypothetical protein